MQNRNFDRSGMKIVHIGLQKQQQQKKHPKPTKQPNPTKQNQNPIKQTKIPNPTPNKKILTFTAGL